MRLVVSVRPTSVLLCIIPAAVIRGVWLAGGTVADLESKLDICVTVYRVDRQQVGKMIDSKPCMSRGVAMRCVLSLDDTRQKSQQTSPQPSALAFHLVLRRTNSAQPHAHRLPMRHSISVSSVSPGRFAILRVAEPAKTALHSAFAHGACVTLAAGSHRWPGNQPRRHQSKRGSCPRLFLRLRLNGHALLECGVDVVIADRRSRRPPSIEAQMPAPCCLALVGSRLHDAEG